MAVTFTHISTCLLLQHKIYQQADKVPEELKEIINEETYNKARVYGLDKSSFSIIKELFGIITTVVRRNLLKLCREELET
jgi:hypothetical protein